MKSLFKPLTLLLGALFLSPNSKALAEEPSDSGAMSVTVIAIANDQSFDTTAATLRYAESTAKRFATVSGGLDSRTTTHLLLAPNGADVETVFSQQALAPTDILILYVASLSDDEGIHLKNKKMLHSQLAAMIDEAVAKRKFVIMDRLMTGQAQPGKQAFRSETYHRKDSYGAPIAYLIADIDQQSSYENHSFRSTVFSDIIIHGIRGRADRDHDGKVSWRELVDYSEATLKFSPHLRGSSRQFVDHCEEDSKGQLNRFSEPAREVTPQQPNSLTESSKSVVETESQADVWLRHYDPTIGILQHRGFRKSESAGVNFMLGLMLYEKAEFSGHWGLVAEMQKHSHSIQTEDSFGTVDYLALSGKLRGRYIFKWETQDLRPQIGVGQVMASQKIETDPNVGMTRSQILAPLLQFGLATHFFRPGSMLHGGLFYRNEIVYGKYDGATQNFKSTGIGLELGYGGGNQ